MAELAERFATLSVADDAAHITTHSTQRPFRYNLGEIRTMAAHVAAHLQHLHIGPKDVVAIQMPAWAEWLVAAYGTLKSWATLLPITAVYGAKDLAYILTNSSAAAYIAPDHWRGVDYQQLLKDCGPLPKLRHRIHIGADARGGLNWQQLIYPSSHIPAPIRLPDAEDVAMLVYTSGTTSRPKAVQHSSRSLWAELQSQAAVKTISGKESILSPWPPGHVAGALSLLRFLTGTADLVLMDEWSPDEAVRLIEQHQVTSISTTPFHLTGILDAADRCGANLSSLQSILSGAAPVPPSLIARCEARGLHPFRCYGSSEMPTVSMGSPSDPLEKRLTTEGRLMPDVAIRFLDEQGRDSDDGEGEIALRGPDLFSGYQEAAHQAQAFTADGWFLSGDVGRLDSDGYLIITDRKKDIIIRGGVNISSREVEDALRLHDDVADVAVVAAPDARMGEIACAFLVTRSGKALDFRDLSQFLDSAGLAKQKRPERLEFVTELPRNATGKILKHELRAMLKVDAPDAHAD